MWGIRQSENRQAGRSWTSVYEERSVLELDGSVLDEHPFSRNAHIQKSHDLFQNSRTHEFMNLKTVEQNLDLWSLVPRSCTQSLITVQKWIALKYDTDLLMLFFHHKAYFRVKNWLHRYESLLLVPVIRSLIKLYRTFITLPFK